MATTRMFTFEQKDTLRYQVCRIIPPKNGDDTPELASVETRDIPRSLLMGNLDEMDIVTRDESGIPQYIRDWDCLNKWHLVYVRLA